MRRLAVLVLVGCGRIAFDPIDPPITAGASALTSGDQFSCAIRPDRTVVCWGDGRRGQLANNELAVKTTVVTTLVTDAVQIEAGIHHACALLGDGRMMCWGDNTYRQVASNDMTPRPAPVEITGLPAAIDKIAVGANHTCALLADRSLWCWGRNADGELGLPASAGVTTPTHVLDDVVEASGGEGFTCALRGDRSVWCWGRNDLGQLGDGTLVDRSTPLAITDFVADHISVGDKHACAVVGGRYTCWGYNNNGELGDGTVTDRPAPGPLSTVGGIVQLDAGNDHNVALLDDGRVVGWGYNEDGAAGGGTSTRYEARPIDVPLTGRIARVSSGGQHSCAQRTDGSVTCWGYGSSGQLANGIMAEWTPRKVPLPAAATWISVGDRHVCAVVGGDVYCWGNNLLSELGTGSTEPASAVPLRVPMLSGIANVSAAGKFSCTSGTTTYCWGANASGELGDGTTTKRPTPVVSMFGNTTAFAGGNQFMCAHRAANTIACSGADDAGQLGDGGGADRSTPFVVPLANAQTIAAGAAHACTLLANSTLSCWGTNDAGQLGVGTMTPSAPPTAVTGVFTEVHAGGHHTCALRSTGELACWGDNNYGELGDGTFLDRPSPTTITVPGGGTITDFGLGVNHTCALRNGQLYCWGPNLRGELGDGSGLEAKMPTLIAPMTLTGIGAGESFTCVLQTGGDVYCWGDNHRGQIGQGTTSRSLVPLEISVP